MIGSHLIKAWSSTQPILAMSSGEAEYYAMVKGASTALGLQSMASEVGYSLGIVLCVDSSAAIGISSRRGLGKVRHIELNQLWLQEHVATGRIAVRKVSGQTNTSDCLTKHSSREKIDSAVKSASCLFATGRDSIMPRIAS